MLVNSKMWDFPCMAHWHLGNLHYNNAVKIPVLLFAVLGVQFCCNTHL